MKHIVKVIESDLQTHSPVASALSRRYNKSEIKVFADTTIILIDKGHSEVDLENIRTFGIADWIKHWIEKSESRTPFQFTLDYEREQAY